MKVTVCFDNVRVVVPCGDGSLLVRELMHEAIVRYRKATGKLLSSGVTGAGAPPSSTDTGPVITSLSSLTGGGLLDPDDRLCDVADDREQIIAHLSITNGGDSNHVGDGASSVGTNSPDFFNDDKDGAIRYRVNDHRTMSNIKRESVKRLSMHALSTRDPHLTTYSALSLPRESRRREPLGQDAKAAFEITQDEVQEIIIKNEPGQLGVHVVPCYDLQGNDQGLRVEKIDPNGRIAKDGRIDLHDKIIRINGHNLLRIHFQKVQEILRSCTNDPCLKISVIKAKKIVSGEPAPKEDDNYHKIKVQSNYNLLQSANTRKIGKMIEIELTKGSDGLGFSVTTRDNPAGGHMPIYIKNILSKGAAVRDGRLRSGDRLLEVNKIEMTGKSQNEVVAFLRSIPPGGKVRMIVSRQEEVSTSNLNELTSGTVSHQQQQQQQQQQQESNPRSWSTPHSSPVNKSNEKLIECYESQKIGPSSPRKKVKHLDLDIPVYDSEKAGLGVSVKGKTSNDQNSNSDLGIFIKSVLHGGAASRDGRLRTNDQLLEINGESLLGLSNSAAMDTLRRAMINSKSATTGIISLKVARQVSSSSPSSPSFDRNKNYQDELITGLGSCKVETANSIYIDDKDDREARGGAGVAAAVARGSEPRIRDRDNFNDNDNDIVDNGNLMSSVSPWNPVIDRLTDQYNKNSIRNESYCLATNKTWRESIGHKLFQRAEDILLEDSQDKRASDKESQYTDDPTYDSQLSLEELSVSNNKFTRDAIGRQSMSEKGHATLDAKNTDTYKRNKKLRQGKDSKNSSNDYQSLSDDEPKPPSAAIAAASVAASVAAVSRDLDIRSGNSSSGPGSGSGPGTGGLGSGTSTGSGSGVVTESSSFEATRRRFEKKSMENTEYVYTIPGNNKARKHWLVDDDQQQHQNQQHQHYYYQQQQQQQQQYPGKEEEGGFSNTRGDVKQASLNSALDKRTKKKE